MFNDRLSPKRALELARLEEIYQYETYGKIDEVHDYEETELLT